MNTDKHKRFNYFKFIRWISVFPGAILAGIIAFYVGWYLTKISLLLTFGIESSMGQFYMLAGSSGFMGIIMVYAASYIAPSYPKKVALIFTGLFILIGGITSYNAYMANDFWRIIRIFVSLAGATGMTVTIIKGEAGLT